MGTDGEVIDRAMDAAEATIAESSVVEEVSTPEPTESTTPTEDIVETVETQKALEKNQEEKEPKEVKVDRAKDGKFVKSQKFDKAGKRITESAEPKQDLVQNVETQEPVTQADQTIEAPMFWSAEDKANFTKATPEVRKAVLRYEEQRNKWGQQLQRDAERGKSYQARLYEGYEPQQVQQHQAELKLNGIRDEVEELHRYRAWDKIFKSDPSRAISDLMKKNGLTPQAFIEGEENQEYVDPRIEQAISEAQAAKAQAEEIKASFEAQKNEAFKTQIDSFKSGKDSQGNTRKAFAEMYAPQISQAYDAIQGSQPMLMEQALHHAYEYVLDNARKQFGVGPAIAAVAPKAKEQVIAQAKKAQAASNSISGAPKSGISMSRPKAKTIDEALDRAEEQVYGR